MKRISVVAAVLMILLSAVPGHNSGAENLDFDIPNGHFYKQANGQGGAGDTGFAVTDDQDVLFWTWFQRLGGVENVGYPVTQRFDWNGFRVQAFQKVVLQWRPDSRTVAIVNVFDELSAAGKDDWLLTARTVPKSNDWTADQGKTPEQVAQSHFALLDQNPAIKQVYFSTADPVGMNGYPMGAGDFGDVFVVRAQRKVFQYWKRAEPWAQAGTVTVSNGGDLGKEAGLYPSAATIPQTPTGDVVIGPSDPGFSTSGLWYVGDGGQSFSGSCFWAPRGPDNVATWRPSLAAPGVYEVFAWWCGDPHSDQSSNAVFTVAPNSGEAYRIMVDLQKNAGQWNSLGTYNFGGGSSGSVSINAGYDYNVVADAVKFVYRGAQPRPPSVPTPAPTPTTVVTNHPPSPLEQLSRGDLGQRLLLNQGGFYPVTPFEGTPEYMTFDDCQAFPGEGCSGQRNGWRARVRYENLVVTYRVSEDYRYVVVEPSAELAGRQRIFLRGQAGDLFFTVDRRPDGSWYLFSNKQQAIDLSQAAPTDVATLRDLAGRYSSIGTGFGTTGLALYGLGPLARMSSADQQALQTLGDRLLARLK